MKTEHTNNAWRWPWLWQLIVIALTGTFGNARADAPATIRAESKFEIRFMENMIDHHAMAVEMGMLCLERTVHPELEGLCQNIVQAQTEEVALMQSWLQSWYGIMHEPEMKPREEKRMERLASLTGSEFEIEFMEMMIEHHTKALTRALRCLDKAYYAELIELCEEMVAAQAEEIQKMETWLREWYGICDQGHRRLGGNQKR